MKWVVRILLGCVGLLVLCLGVLFVVSKRPHAGDMHSQIEIAAPPQVVFEWVTQPDKLTKWVSWLVEVRDDSPGVNGVGAHHTWIMNDPNMKKQMRMPAEITAYDPPRGITVRVGAKGMFLGDASYTLTPTANGTLLRSDSSWKYFDLFSQIMEPLITPEAIKKERMDFATLKRLVEAK